MPMPPLMKLREAMRQTLNHASVLAQVPTGNIRLRPRKLTTTDKAITYFDFGTRPDPTVPLLDRIVQVDIWAKTLNDCELIGQLVEARLTAPNLVELVKPELKLCLFALQADRDAPEEDNAEVVHKILEYRCLAYQLAA